MKNILLICFIVLSLCLSFTTWQAVGAATQYKSLATKCVAKLEAVIGGYEGCMYIASMMDNAYDDCLDILQVCNNRLTECTGEEYEDSNNRE